MSLGEDLMKPSATLYRNLLSMEIEESVRSQPLDAVVILAACDKSVPGALMGPRSGVSVGDRLSIRFNPDHYHFFDSDSGRTLRRS
jgi:hypothetical protein